MRRSLVVVIALALWMLVGAGAASADPPGPTDYQSEVTEIDPDVPGIELEIIGGDSFVLLTVAEGLAVEVVGYGGEPYLRFLEDGTVEENRLSPSKYLNEDRYAAVDMPDDADTNADPDWIFVADDGSYAWHDHRTHWMNEQPPPGRGPGDQIVEGVVPMLVAGVEVDVTVVSIWQDAPSSLPVAVGFTLGLLLAYVAWRRRGSGPIHVLLLLALAASIAGGGAYLSMPAETVPPWSLWVFPATSLVLTLVILAGKSRSEVIARHQQTLLLIAALELVGWGVAHWDWLWPAVLPTALPFWLDRLVASAVLSGALGAAAAVIVDAAAPTRSDLFGS